MAERVVEKLRVTQKVEEKRDFQETRKDIPCIASMDPAEAAELIAENPAYGRSSMPSAGRWGPVPWTGSNGAQEPVWGAARPVSVPRR